MWATIGGYLAAVLLGSLLLNCKTHNGELKAELKNQVAETEQALNANKTNMATITELQITVSDMVAERQANAEQREKELAERDRKLAKANAEAVEARKRRDEILRSTQSCEAYSNLVVADLCPAIASELRQRSTGSN